MSDSVIHPAEFHKLIGVMMKERYAHEQRAADNDLSLQRQRSERSRSASRTPDRLRSLSNVSLGSRAATCGSGILQPGGRPPYVPSHGRTPVPMTESLSWGARGRESTPLTDAAQSSTLTNVDGDSPRAEQPASESMTRPLASNNANRTNGECVVDPHEGYPSESERNGFGGLTALSRRFNALTSPIPESECNQMSSYDKEYKCHLEVTQPQGACLRCIELEAKVQSMQEVLNKLTSDVVILAARQATDESLSMKDGVISDIPDDPEELGGTMEEKFLTVVTSLAKRVRRLEVDLEASLEQVRVMEAAAIERDRRLNDRKVGREEIKEAVARELHSARLDCPNEVMNMYRAWGLDPKNVREALNSSNPAACMDLLLATPPFARLLRIVMDSNSDILSVLHEQQLRSRLDEHAGSQHMPSMMALKNPVPLHELLLGVYLHDEKEVQGVRVISVPMGSPAAHTVSPGDVIVQVNHVTVRSVADVSYVLSRARPRAPITLSIQVNDRPHVEVVQLLPLEIP